MLTGQALLVELLNNLPRHGVVSGVGQDLRKRRLYTRAAALDGRIRWTDRANEIAAFVRSRNYEPFACPTGPAVSTTDAGEYIEVLRVVKRGTTSESPGRVVAATADGALVAAGDGQTLLVTKARARFADGPSDPVDWTKLTGRIFL
jgi:methionyl-tRNA formyltransferase